MRASIRSKLMAISTAIAYPPIHLKRQVVAKEMRGKWAIVTGASHGIGRALTEELISLGANIFLLARSEAELQMLCAKAKEQGCHADYCAIDLRNREQLNRLCQKLRKDMPQVDYLFCNAGKSIHRNIALAIDRLHDYDRTMDLNYRSLVALSLALLPALQTNKGHIVYSSSVSSLYPMAPGWSAYHASKVAANAWLDTARIELKKLGVRVHVAYLPLVHTQMSDVNRQYRNLPAYNPANAAQILLRLCIGKKYRYQPWWATLSVPIARVIAPIIRLFYQKL